MPRERPILFSGPMVRAILEGRKTQTRRVANQVIGQRTAWQSKENCPYGQPGDRLWVRETFCLEDGLEEPAERPTDGRPVKEGEFGPTVPHYRATEPEPNIVSEEQFNEGDDITKWKPAIHMPRWASRITLEVTDVRVQRIQDISEADAKAEGVEPDSRYIDHYKSYLDSKSHYPSARGSFISLWNSINAAKGFGWAENPWVWAISFKRFSANEGREEPTEEEG